MSAAWGDQVEGIVPVPAAPAPAESKSETVEAAEAVGGAGDEAGDAEPPVDVDKEARTWMACVDRDFPGVPWQLCSLQGLLVSTNAM